VSDKALVVGIDDYRELPPLQNACSEAAAIAALLGVQPRLDSAASLEAVLSAAEGCSTLHLACHGSFAWDTSPFASALYLAQDEALTLARILSGELSLEAARIVTLSACETGFTEIADLPDEFIGLPAGFLQAGASAVVSSLWSVDDYSTAILMGKFYEYLLEGQQPPSEALAAAQKWLSAANRVELGGYFRSPRLRQLPGSHDIPYAHPYYWAAFTFTGA
jgi:CHAT domain-containing protein